MTHVYLWIPHETFLISKVINLSSLYKSQAVTTLVLTIDTDRYLFHYNKWYGDMIVINHEWDILRLKLKA